MTGHWWGIYRVSNQKLASAKEKALYDAAAATAINVLREPLPDTFLGRKHYDPVPLPEEIELAPIQWPVRLSVLLGSQAFIEGDSSISINDEECGRLERRAQLHRARAGN
ncbi:hypothetical protein [Bradyrhizobium sp. USDA 4454]